jgi:hypothetical protein
LPGSCYNLEMLRYRVIWVTKCVLYSIAGNFVAGRLSGLLNPLVWWILHKAGITFLQRPAFSATYYLPLTAAYGFCLGLIPIHQLQELVLSFFGRFQSEPRPVKEIQARGPLVWAWVPIGLVFAFRFLMFKDIVTDSVLGSPAYGEGRYEHFFAPFSAASVTNVRVWIFDRFLVAGPTFFLIAYSAAVWLRHQFPAKSIAAVQERENIDELAEPIRSPPFGA